MNPLIKLIYLFIFFNLFTLSMSKEVVKIYDWKINKQDKMEVYYFLNYTDDNENNQFYVTLMVSINNGETWFKPKSIDGNYGLQTPSRSKKIIIWDIFSDKNKLEGYVKVKLIAKSKTSIFEEIFSLPTKKKSSTRNIYEEKNRLGITLSGFEIDFPNSTYQKHIEMGVIEKRRFPFTIGINAELVEMPIKLLVSAKQTEFNINQPVPFLDYNYSSDDNPINWVVSDTITTEFDSNGLYNYNEDVDNNNFYRYAFQSIGASYLYSPLSKINYINPFFGLGFQFSRIQLYEIGNINVSYDINDANTSDFFWICSVDLNINSIIINVSYQESIFRQLRKWNELSINLGIKLEG